jgi:hypothetical protein
VDLLMRHGVKLLGLALLLPSVSGMAMTHTRRGPTSQHLPRVLHRSSRAAARPASQRSIDDGRAAEIQNALIGAGYLTGEASGHWDSSTETAMQKFQSDNGWQTKLIPDSRAIIKLGLGPRTETEAQNSAAHASDSATLGSSSR